MSGSKGNSGGITELENEHSMPYTGNPNSRTDLYKNGIIYQQRWYGPKGTPIRNRDYTDHGNSKEHPMTPHDHEWTPIRQKDIPPDYNWR